MKNLTIKKIAFGLLMAGYASSSAFASTLTAETTQVIQGNAPVLSKINGSDAEHTVSVTFTSDSAGNTPIADDENVKVGNYMKISYNLLDDDGDADNKNIKDSLVVYAKINGNWEKFKAADLNADVTVGANVGGRQSGSIIFQISSEFAGAEKIGFRLQERTEFGLPNENKWINVSDVWSDEKPEIKDKGDEPNDPPSGPAGPGDDDLPVPGKGPILSDTFRVGIFKYDANDKLDQTVNYATSAATNPKYGDKFGAIVWNDTNSNEDIDSGEMIFTSAYKYQWKLSGNYESVDAIDEVLTGSTNTTAEGDTILLGSSQANHNSLYNGTYKAGAQGYKLKVEAKN